jgi:superfamily II DNA or RNA helicase
MSQIQPRLYQTEAVAAIVDAHARGVQRALVALPTGTGKTVVFALLLQQRGGRSLVLTHRDELIQQAVDKLHIMSSTMSIGTVKAERDESNAPVVVASVQTLSRAQRLERLTPGLSDRCD